MKVNQSEKLIASVTKNKSSIGFNFADSAADASETRVGRGLHHFH